MNPFTVMKVRGHIFGDQPEGSGSGLHAGADQEGDTDVLTGASPSKASPAKRMTARDYRMPVDLARSRRYGLSRTACVECLAVKHEGYCRHEVGCHADGGWFRQTTGPLASYETSDDTGWF